MDALESEKTLKEGNLQPAKKLISTKKLFIVVLIVITAGLGVIYGVRAFRGNDEGAGTDAGSLEIEEVVSQVSRHLLLPQGEVPTLATIIDAATLAQEQAFYQNASDGDKLLIYLQNQRAIIYNPKQDIIVNVGPIVVDTPTQNVSSLDETVEVVSNVEEDADPVLSNPSADGFEASDTSTTSIF